MLLLQLCCGRACPCRWLSFRPPGAGGCPAAADCGPAAAPSPADANAQALFDYLTTSADLPESTRRWPAWRQRLVPKIVLALSGRWLGPGAAQQGAAGAVEAGPEAAAQAAPSSQAAAAIAVAAPQEAPAAADAMEEREPVGHADKEATAAAEDGCGTRGTGADASHQPAMDQQQQQPEQAAHLVPTTAAAAAGLEPSKAKENKQTQNSGAVAAAKDTPDAACPQHRSSRRQRKANSKFAEFVTADGAEAGEEEA